MSSYVVNLERLMALSVTVEVDDPADAVAAAKALYEAGSVDWDAAPIDQTAACCLATGDGGFTVISQKQADA
uniref:Uncharacterized protein n=1 Tax=uncultured bacterium scaffold00056 TaxID=1132475 RepID=I7AVI7_9BACT|nr:hypothetical protein [uncultured bacterium scaffold00056]